MPLMSANTELGLSFPSVNAYIVCVGEHVPLEEFDGGVANVYFGPLRLGRPNERHMRLEDAYGRLKRRNV